MIEISANLELRSDNQMVRLITNDDGHLNIFFSDWGAFSSLIKSYKKTGFSLKTLLYAMRKVKNKIIININYQSTFSLEGGKPKGLSIKTVFFLLRSYLF